MDKGETVEMLKEMHKQVDSGEKFSPDSLQKLASLLNTLELSDEEKQDFGESLNDLLGKLKSLSGPSMGMGRGGMDISASGNLLMQITLVVAFIVIITLFVFFGYKLYRSLTEKERKRDEKRKQKQMKKKK